MSNSIPQTPDGRTPEARVLIVMTGGTICMQKSVDGYVPARGFLEKCMGPRPEFNDGTEHDPVEAVMDDGTLHKSAFLCFPMTNSFFANVLGV